MQINSDRLSKLCNEISELETKVQDLVLAEITTALIDLISILNKNAPSLENITWHQSDKQIVKNIFFLPFSATSTQEQKDFLDEIRKLIKDNCKVFILAFGSNVNININLLTGKITAT